MKFKQYLKELSYFGNIGFEEFTKFWQNATPEQEKAMKNALERDDTNAVLGLLRDVLGITLRKLV